MGYITLLSPFRYEQDVAKVSARERPEGDAIRAFVYEVETGRLREVA